MPPILDKLLTSSMHKDLFQITKKKTIQQRRTWQGLRTERWWERTNVVRPFARG